MLLVGWSDDILIKHAAGLEKGQTLENTYLGSNSELSRGICPSISWLARE